jgi:hypothetical protein
LVLDLSSNRIRERGIQSISEMLKLNTSLLRVELGFNNLNQKSKIAIQNALSRNKNVVCNTEDTL